MTPPEATQAGQKAPAGEAPPAVSVCRLIALRQRADFLSANHGLRQGRPGFLLQARKRQSDDATPDSIRVGFTCSRKVGNAVARNRAKRRLREIARLDLPTYGQPGWDYVLIGRKDATADLPFQTLRRDLRTALARIHAKGQGG